MKWLEQWLTFAGRNEEGDSFPSQLVYSDFRSTEEIKCVEEEKKSKMRIYKSSHPKWYPIPRMLTEASIDY